MKEKIKKLIEEYSAKGDFIGKIANDEIIASAELRLGIAIPEEYKWFINNYGQGGIGGVEILGVSKLNKALFEEVTLDYREYGLPKELIVVENCGEWLYCIDTSTEKVVTWNRKNGVSGSRYNTFLAFLQDRLSDEIENM